MEAVKIAQEFPDKTLIISNSRKHLQATAHQCFDTHKYPAAPTILHKA